MNMSDPFDILNISPTNDLKTIKRAYARLLKKHRPDDDPVGFQTLYDAYQAALKVAQSDQSDPLEQSIKESATHNPSPRSPLSIIDRHNRDIEIETDVDEKTDSDLESNDQPDEPISSPSRPQNDYSTDQPIAGEKQTNQKPHHDAIHNDAIHDGNIADPVDPPFDCAAIYRELIARTTDLSRHQLATWLTHYAPFWDLNFKTLFAEYLFHQLQQVMPPIHRDQFDYLTQFFHFDRLSSSLESGYLLELADELHHIWITTYQPDYYDKKIRAEIGDRFFRQLQKPFHWSSFLLQSFPPWRAYRRSRQVDHLLENYRPNERQSLNETALEQWHSILYGERRFPGARIIVQIHQLTLLLLLTPIIVSLISGIFGNSFLFDPAILYFLKENSVKLVIVLLLILVTFPRFEITERHYQTLHLSIRNGMGLLSLIFFYSTYQFSYFVHHQHTRPNPLMSPQNIVDRIAGSSKPMPSESERDELWQEALAIQSQYPNDDALNHLLLLYNANNRDQKVMKTTYYLLKQKLGEIALTENETELTAE